MTRRTVQLVPGLFNVTLEPFLQEHVHEAVIPEHAALDRREEAWNGHAGTGKKQKIQKKLISFVNMDMDLYTGAVYVLQHILPHMSSGAILHFHDFFNAATACYSGEMRALYDVLFSNHSVFGHTKESAMHLQMMPFETLGFREPLVFRVL